MNIGYVIKVLRKQRKLTQEQIALDAEIATSNVSRIEKGLRQPSQAVLQKISKALDTSPAVLYAACELPHASIPDFLENEQRKAWGDADQDDLHADMHTFMQLFQELTPKHKSLLFEQLKALHRWQTIAELGSDGQYS
ncbi:helix-turn-helix domain-containing protein [Marinomonas ostreistagni]|uniref:helix-turn-helix domain-containing protein n=1 Tax=Marinomonas ostreistagni TaxID=359209 RepID=UPI001951B197|nr:helix-turn-helix domain-containing protein [Marinomonas ostreistagni]MBM6551829.1 helix-turn-helix domain-containing protein [Marinomonas ostreistagni]